MVGGGSCATSVLTISACLLLLLTMTCRLAAGATEDDKIESLPGITQLPNFKQYSGYLNGKSDNIQLHYWLTEAADNSETKPLLLWLNGGPGCSSLDGLLNENGPFVINDDGSLSNREYSWNKIANVLYLETPAGTGFSYAVDGNINTSDDDSADNNYEAMRNFLTKFTEYNGRDFYIAGQSFAGVYIPTLAKRLFESPIGLALKGIAIGNGLTNNEFNDNSLLYYTRYHGVIDKKMWENVMEKCCASEPKLRCNFTKGLSETECKKLLGQIRTKQAAGLDYYNIYRPCDGGVKKPTTPTKKSVVAAAAPPSEEFDDNFFVDGHRMSAQMSFYGSETCLNYTALETYLNRADVKKALHITKVDITWKVCNKILPNYKRQYRDQKDFVLTITRKTDTSSPVNVLIYNGDVDGVCNVIGGDWFAESLGLTQTGTYSRWLYTNEKQEQQVGGWRKTYDADGTKVIFATVRGSGHMVPRDTPASAYHMINSFITSASLD